jgi:hypothetical protein
MKKINNKNDNALVGLKCFSDVFFLIHNDALVLGFTNYCIETL